jgi:hypothetical protein
MLKDAHNGQMVADVRRREVVSRCEMKWEFWNGWARQLEKREQSRVPITRVCGSRSLRRSIGFGNRVVVALDGLWAQRGARPTTDVRESLGPARPVTDSLKSQSSTRDHPYEHVIFPNKLMKQRCPDMSHQAERQGQADHAVQYKRPIGERLVGWPAGAAGSLAALAGTLII